MDGQIYRAGPGPTPDTTSPSSPDAHTAEDTPSPSSTAQHDASAGSSPGAGRFGELHIRNRSASPVEHAPSHLPPETETPAPEPLSQSSERSDHDRELPAAVLSRVQGRPFEQKASHDPDTLSNVAQRSLRDTNNSSSAAMPSILPPTQPPSHREIPSDVRLQDPQDIDGSQPDITLPVHTAKTKPITTAAACQAHISSGIFLQPETHPITEEQLINEVRAIYAGLVMVEKKCIEIDKQQSSNPEDLKDVQWQALIALHRTLLHEHHDFFLASNHPAASTVLKKLAEKYSMPARMWRYGIHSFLELLRKKLPGSLEHMLTFIYMAYSMMTLLLESVPAFEGTWIECLGDLARYRMAVEEIDMRDRDIWSGVARYWYSRAADKSPEIGRIQHHLAVLARPNLLQQLFYYSKSLTSIQPFTNARDSISLVFNPLLDSTKPVNKTNREAMVLFVKVHGLFFTRGAISTALLLAETFLCQLNDHIKEVGAKFREEGVYISSACYAAIFDFGHADGQILPMFDHKKLQKSKVEIVDAALKYWADPPYQQTSIALRKTPNNSGINFQTSDQIVSYASHLAFKTLSLILQPKIDESVEGKTLKNFLQNVLPNVLPCAHVSLAFLWCTALVPKSMEYIQADVPWASIANFLNYLIKPETNMDEIESEEFPIHEPGTSKQLAEDFLVRGLAWSQLYYPENFFSETPDDEERSIELPSVIVPRTRRCLWLGLNIAKLKCWIEYNPEERKFYATSFANGLARLAEQYQILEKPTKQSDIDATMTDV